MPVSRDHTRLLGQIKPISSSYGVHGVAVGELGYVFLINVGVDNDKTILLSTPFPTIPIFSLQCFFVMLFLFYVGNKRYCIVLYFTAQIYAYINTLSMIFKTVFRGALFNFKW